MNLFRLTAVAGMVVIGGCRDTTAPISSTQLGANQVRLTVSASAAEIVRGSPVNLHITLVNEGAQAVTLHFRDSCQINPYIRDDAGAIVLPGVGGWACLTMLTNLTLAPAETVSRDYVWTGSSSFSTGEPSRALPPGKYLFSAVVPAEETTLNAAVGITLK